jgi:hypothetical protein
VELICQMDHLGRLLVHQEVPGTNVGLEKHVSRTCDRSSSQTNISATASALVGDPSGVAKGNVSEESCFDALQRLGLPCFPAPTNDIEPRCARWKRCWGQQTNGGPR